MRVYALYICSFLCICLNAQHSAVYSQYMFNGLLINPAYAGSNDALNLTGLYRTQWLGIEGAPVNTSFTAHAPLSNKHVNLGAIFTNDCFGISTQNKASLVYAYRLRLGKGALAFGLQGGVNFYQVNWAKVKTTDAADPAFNSSNYRKVLPDAGAGVYYHSAKFFIGLSMPEMIKTSLYDYKPVILFSGVVIKASPNFHIKPAVLVKYIKNSPYEINVSSTFYWKEVIGLGLGYRVKDAAVAFFDLRVNQQFHLGYAYDYTLSRLRNYSSGSHEIMLRYLFMYKVNAQSSRYF